MRNEVENRCCWLKCNRTIRSNNHWCTIGCLETQNRRIITARVNIRVTEMTTLLLCISPEIETVQLDNYTSVMEQIASHQFSVPVERLSHFLSNPSRDIFRHTNQKTTTFMTSLSCTTSSFKQGTHPLRSYTRIFRFRFLLCY